MQTIRILRQDTPKLDTKLRHIDVHQLSNKLYRSSMMIKMILIDDGVDVVVRGGPEALS